jgi:hypothetical protein
VRVSAELPAPPTQHFCRVEIPFRSINLSVSLTQEAAP